MVWPLAAISQLNQQIKEKCTQTTCSWMAIPFRTMRREPSLKAPEQVMTCAWPWCSRSTTHISMIGARFRKVSKTSTCEPLLSAWGLSLISCTVSHWQNCEIKFNSSAPNPKELIWWRGKPFLFNQNQSDFGVWVLGFMKFVKLWVPHICIPWYFNQRNQALYSNFQIPGNHHSLSQHRQHHCQGMSV